jgi:RimJ/RimL family protein N-acetyltransferase
MMLLAKHCFETLNLQRVFLRVYADNLRAQRAYQKAGFIEEGRLRQAVFKRGAYQDAILMSVLRTEWSAHSKEN